MTSDDPRQALYVSDMDGMADEAYAVAGAVPSLVQHATAVIGSNDDDAVARRLDARWRCSD